MLYVYGREDISGRAKEKIQGMEFVNQKLKISRIKF